MREIVERLDEIEERLARVVVSGWRNAGAEARALGAEAAWLDEAGLPHLGARLRAVADAEGATEGLRAMALASAAIRSVRLRLLPDWTAGDEWRPLRPAKRRGSAPDEVQPLCRIATEDGELWSCVRPRGWSVEWLLIRPPALAMDGWFTHRLAGRLRWVERRPLGTAAEVNICALADAVPAGDEERPALPAELLAAIRTGTGGAPPAYVVGGGKLLVEPFAPDALDTFAWLDETHRAAVAGVDLRRASALVWEHEGLRVLIAAMEPQTRTNPPRVVHLAARSLREAI